jgi:hypothetical protein
VVRRYGINGNFICPANTVRDFVIHRVGPSQLEGVNTRGFDPLGLPVFGRSFPDHSLRHGWASGNHARALGGDRFPNIASLLRIC